MKFDTSKAHLRVLKVGDRYEAIVRPPHANIEWKTPEPMELTALMESMVSIGCNVRDLQDVITEANKKGEGYIP